MFRTFPLDFDSAWPFALTFLLIATGSTVANADWGKAGPFAGEWRSDNMWFSLHQSENGLITGQYGRPNQVQIGEIRGYAKRKKALLKYRTPGGNGDIEWHLSGDSTATVHWWHSDSTGTSWTGSYTVTRHHSVPTEAPQSSVVQQTPQAAPSRNAEQGDGAAKGYGHLTLSAYGMWLA